MPRNLLELRSILDGASALADGGRIELEHLPRAVSCLVPESTVDALSLEIPDEGIDLEARVMAFERVLLEKGLAKAGGVRKRAARLLGVTFRSLRYRLHKHGFVDGTGEDET